MLLAAEPNQFQEGIRRSRRIGGHAGRDIEVIDGIIEVARSDALTKEHDIARSGKGSARDNQPLNAGYTLSACQTLAGGMVVRDQLVGSDLETTRSSEVDLHKGLDVDSKRPRAHAEPSKVVNSPEISGSKHLGEGPERMEGKVLRGRITRAIEAIRRAARFYAERGPKACGAVGGEFSWHCSMSGGVGVACSRGQAHQARQILNAREERLRLLAFKLGARSVEPPDNAHRRE